jgi:biopolymer transport protein TolR
MAFSSNSNRSRGRKKSAISDINITPFVDVLLVLLIIFMVAAPMMTGSINIDLPKGSSGAISEKAPPVAVTIKKDGSIFLQEDVVKLATLPKLILKVTNNNIGAKIFVRADKRIDYGRVMEVVKQINSAGYSKVVLVTQLVH